MSDRIKGLTVTLRPDMRDDDAEFVINAIRMIKGVVDASSHVASIDHHFAMVTIRREMRDRLLAVLDEEFKPKP